MRGMIACQSVALSETIHREDFRRMVGMASQGQEGAAFLYLVGRSMAMNACCKRRMFNKCPVAGKKPDPRLSLRSARVLNRAAPLLQLSSSSPPSPEHANGGGAFAAPDGVASRPPPSDAPIVD